MAAPSDAMETTATAPSTLPVDDLILKYLKHQGYTDVEKLFEKKLVSSADAMSKKMAASDDDRLLNYLKLHEANESHPQRYDASYSAFKEWAHSALEIYKGDLCSVLFPLLAHSFLDLVQAGASIGARKFLDKHAEDFPDHTSDISQLRGITEKEHITQNKYAMELRSNKFQLEMSGYAFKLLLAYLNEKNYMLLLTIITVFCTVKVTSGHPKLRQVEHHHASLPGEARAELDSLLDQEVKWGLTKRPRIYAGLPPGERDDQNSLVPLPRLNPSTEEKLFEDIRRRVHLSAETPASICCYTFFNTHTRLTQIAISPRGNLVAASLGSVIKFWDLEKENSEWTRLTERYLDASGRTPVNAPSKKDSYFSEMLGHSGPVFGMSFSPNSDFLLSAGQDCSVRLWSVATKHTVAVFRGHSHPVWDVQFSPLGYYFVTASNDRTAMLWATDRKAPLRIFAGHLSDVNCVRFHPNCNYVVTGSTDKCVRLWEVNTGATVRLFTGHTSSVVAIAVSPDGRHIASGSEDGVIIVWDLATSKRVRTNQAHTASITALTFSSDCAQLSSAAMDSTVKIWDMSEVAGRDKKKDVSKVSEGDGAGDAMDVDEKAGGAESGAGGGAATGVDAENSGDEDVVPGTPPLVNLHTYPTKSTPIFTLQFTMANLLLCGGRFDKAALADGTIEAVEDQLKEEEEEVLEEALDGPMEDLMDE